MSESIMERLRWRDVADELPQEAQEVLFVRGGKTVHGAWIGGIFWHSNQKMAATYWMPLPSPQTDAALREEVQPAAPDMAEVERLLLHFEKRAPWVRHEQRAALLDYVRQFAAAPQPVFALTEDQIQRHKIRADDCLPDSEVLLVRSVRRFADKAAPQPVSEEALDILRSENERLRACLRDVQREALTACLPALRTTLAEQEPKK